MRNSQEGRKEGSFRRLNIPATDTHQLYLPPCIFQKDRPGNTCSFPPMIPGGNLARNGELCLAAKYWYVKSLARPSRARGGFLKGGALN